MKRAPQFASGATTVTIPLVKPLSLFGPRINQVDLRGTKIFRFGGRRIQANVDAYNLFNVNTPDDLARAEAIDGGN